MTIRIIGGIGKSLSLFVPKESLTRPTSVLLKRRIFDSNQNIGDYIFVDLCAGSGAVGLEALSRGSKSIYLVESNSTVFKIMQKNVKKMRDSFPEQLEDRVIKEVQAPVQKWIGQFRKQYQEWSEEDKAHTILFFDPPYQKIDLYKSVIVKELLEKEWFEGMLWVESDEDKGVSLAFWENYVNDGPSGKRKLFRQGNSYILIIDCQRE